MNIVDWVQPEDDLPVQPIQIHDDHNLNLDEGRKVAVPIPHTVQTLSQEIEELEQVPLEDEYRGGNAEQRAEHACRWLSCMYEPQDNVSMPRSALYDHYLEACSVNNHEPVNSATFGKLLRAVFPMLRTRRLGTRGNSKYHYYGIGIKKNQMGTVPPRLSTLLRTTPPGGSRNTSVKKKIRTGYSHPHQAADSPLMSRKTGNILCLEMGSKAANFSSAAFPASMTLQQPFHDLSDFGRFLEQLCAPNPASLPLHIPYEHLQAFAASYHRLLYDKASLIAAQAFNQYVTVSLFPTVCDPSPPGTLQSIRHFAKSHEQTMAAILPPSLPLILVESKLQASRKFALGLRRRTSMGHLAQAVRAVLEGQPDMIRQMRTDWLHLDLLSVREQLSWVFRVSDSYCSGLEQGVCELLTRQAPLAAWLAWVEGCIEQCLATGALEDTARHLTLRWSLFTSLLLRDLTLKGGHSFGSFHLLRLLLDEYVMFYVERRLEEAARGSSLPAKPVHNVDCGGNVDSREEYPGLRQDVLLTPNKQQRWQRVISEESLIL